MDANKDEAVKCLNIAMNFLAINRSRALKFLNKARRLDPSIEIDEFLSLQPEAKNANPNPNETTKEKPPLNPLPTSSEREQVQVQVAKRKKAEQEQVQVQVSKREKTEQVAVVREIKRKKAEQEQVQVSKREKAKQVAVVREIKRKKDYYDILGVGKNSSAEDIRKAYRKLSLKVHPDKNWAPGAEDSFKKLSNAFQCLSNTESRRRYDLQTSPVSVSRSSSKVSVSRRRRSSSSRVDCDVVIHIIFRVGANLLYSLGQPFTMKELMRVARSKAQSFQLSGSFRLKYEYEGKIIFLPKEEELGADNELRTCMHRWLSVRQEPVVFRAEFI